ncbi:putative death-receptor fusion protein-domain-containing protein [Emericellopsis atlantica]|uniref:Death-receptor fusion protein-domain-containing protein n=1 Tax=Emericellopsis atlantica TaxID=2614577 RepID=A0A9P8CQ52_9HYPO|nr:putative death-receptor fusion protein-domain-containing protein [Emericellopsis atlantica]KAG9254907.1 putative death-receptor fusion protein-domain-containing protein [Emericellopsis atlantica]
MQKEEALAPANLLEKQDQVLKWLEEQPNQDQAEYASCALDVLLKEAGQTKSASGNACLRLCSFVEQCSKLHAPSLQQWAFSGEVSKKAFTFYIEWNETDQHRSMKLVLDLLAQLDKRNPDAQAARATRDDLLTSLISILTGKSTKPVVKSAIKTIDHFLAKNVFGLEDLRDTYVRCRSLPGSVDETETWRRLFADIIYWARMRTTSPVTGKLIVNLYRALRTREGQWVIEPSRFHQWLLDFIQDGLSALEDVKNYIFLPMFKVDRAESLRYLKAVSDVDNTAWDLNQQVSMPTLLQLAALETGKRVGFVEEPAASSERDIADDKAPVILHEEILSNVLCHPAQEVRSLAYSLLTVSPSTTRPYSTIALELLRKHLGTYFADSDPKFRVDVMARARDMYRRIRGAIATLKRSIPRARAKAKKLQEAANDTSDSNERNTLFQTIMYHTNLIYLPESQLVQCLEEHVQFLRWYNDFLRAELAPTASYQRHYGSLKALSFVLRMEADPNKGWETEEDQEMVYDLFDSSWARALFDLVMDPFDDVREYAAAAIKSLHGNDKYRKFRLTASQSRTDDLRVQLKRSLEVAHRTSRADHSDGAARASQLLYKFSSGGDERVAVLSRLLAELEDRLLAAETDLGQAVLGAPAHGHFASLCCVWQIVSQTTFDPKELEAVKSLQSQAVQCCSRIWQAVRSILCDDSPEGYLPEEMEALEGLDTKDVLSYSFRAVHEASNLLKTIILTTKNHANSQLISPSVEIFEQIGDLTFEQLATLRHRGAFSTVANTFTSCCQQIKFVEAMSKSKGEQLLCQWYKGTLESIYGQVSTTRRSAGIPSLITGILSANAANPSFEQVIEKLFDIASVEARVRETDASNLPQVHAYNSIKDIFRNSLLTALGNKSEKYLTPALQLAANGLRSEVWAIRNCGLILLRSLLNMLFGHHESKTMIEAGWDGKANRIPYHKYPALVDVLVDLLESGEKNTEAPATLDTSGAEAVFPALDIIRRAGPPEALREKLQDLVAKYLADPVWHVREMAARTLCSCHLHDGWLRALRALLKVALADRSSHAQNHVHGVLLTLKFVFERLSKVAPEHINAHLPELVGLLEHERLEDRFQFSPEVIAAYLELFNQMQSFSLSRSIPLGFRPSLRKDLKGSALLKIQKSVFDTYAAYQSEDPVQQLRKVLLVESPGSDGVIASIELIPKLWKTSSLADDTYSALCVLCIDLCLSTTVSEQQAAVLDNLADALSERPIYESNVSERLVEMWTALPNAPTSPLLSNAVLRASGCIIPILSRNGVVQAEGLRQWGRMIADAGLEDKSFDVRYAATEGLFFFLKSAAAHCTSEEHLPVLLAVYDALNDDDDEIRELAAAAAQFVYGQALVPLEAATRLLDWLAQTFKNTARFKEIVATRLTGSKGDSTAWRPAEDMINHTLKLDDALFAIEEQNLFFDEVREVKRWSSTFTTLSWAGTETSLAQLDRWLIGGMRRLHLLLEQGDVPLGWGSAPHVFAICSTILVGSSTLVASGKASAELQDAFRQSAIISTDDQKNGINVLLKVFVQ